MFSPLLTSIWKIIIEPAYIAYLMPVVRNNLQMCVQSGKLWITLNAVWVQATLPSLLILFHVLKGYVFGHIQLETKIQSKRQDKTEHV